MNPPYLLKLIFCVIRKSRFKKMNCASCEFRKLNIFMWFVYFLCQVLARMIRKATGDRMRTKIYGMTMYVNQVEV